jgi:serine protease Do
VLTQLAARPKYDELAEEIAGHHARLDPSLLVLDVEPEMGRPDWPRRRVAALRFRDDLAVTLLPGELDHDGASLLAKDPASGLAIVRVAGPSSAAPPLWVPRRLRQPRHVIATDVAATAVSLRPLFVGVLDDVEIAPWPQPVWILPDGSGVDPGTFLFSSDGELVGVVTAYGPRRAVVPGATLLAEAERLLARPKAPGGHVGVEVQALTPDVAAVTGAASGVVVAWVEPEGAATGLLKVGDVIEVLDGQPLTARERWDVRLGRLSEGEAISIRIRREGEARDVTLVGKGRPVPADSGALGLTMRGRRGDGAAVVAVEPGSAADRAGVITGDVITQVGSVTAPTPAQVARSFAVLREGQRVMIAVTRGGAHHVTTLMR